jgi:hypothetical protein
VRFWLDNQKNHNRMPDNGPGTTPKAPCPVDSGHGDGAGADFRPRRGSGWLVCLVPGDARFLIPPLLPQPDDETGDRVLKAVTILAIVGVICGLSYTAGRHMGTGGSVLLLREKALGLENAAAEAARSTPPDNEKFQQLQREGARLREAANEIRQKL